MKASVNSACGHNNADIAIQSRALFVRDCGVQNKLNWCSVRSNVRSQLKSARRRCETSTQKPLLVVSALLCSRARIRPEAR